MTASPPQPSLFDVCMIPACTNPVADIRVPCGECLDAFGILLTAPAGGVQVTEDEYRAMITARDEDTARTLAARRMLAAAGARPAPPTSDAAHAARKEHTDSHD